MHCNAQQKGKKDPPLFVRLGEKMLYMLKYIKILQSYRQKFFVETNLLELFFLIEKRKKKFEAKSFHIEKVYFKFMNGF